MNPHQLRILIVDDRRQAARALRTALEEACPGCTATLVPSGEEALLELRQPFDLLVVNDSLPGMPGADLLARAQNIWSGLRAVVITDGSLDDAVAAMQQVEVLWFFQRPADDAAIAGTISRALAGDSTEPAAPALNEPPPVQAPRPPAQPVARLLSALRADLGAEGVALIGAGGEALLVEAAGTLPDVDAAASVLCEHCTGTSALAGLLGGPAQSVHYYEGETADVYTLTAGPDTLIAIFFPGGSARQLGAVLLHGRRAARRVAALLDPSSEARLHPPPTPAAPHTGAVAAGEEPELAELPEPAPVWDVLDDEAEEIDFDLDGLADDLANGGGDDLDTYWEEAASLHTKVSDDALSLDEAVELGLFDDDDNA